MKKKTLLSIKDFTEMGGEMVPGAKLYTNPEYLLLFDDREDVCGVRTGGSSVYTFVEILPGGVKVEEKESLLGTGWLYLWTEIELANTRPIDSPVPHRVVVDGDDWGKCLKCGSSMKRGGFLGMKVKGCLNPECEDYFENEDSYWRNN